MSEEEQTPTKPTKTEETPKTQIHNRYETISVPILRPSEYPIWKVRMTMFLEATDPEYLDRINEGPHKPTKLSVVVADQPAKTVPKEKSEYTAEDISSIAKDAKVRHLLHSAIDNVMSNRVINCKTAKEIWYALETRCQGTDVIKKNRRTILTQEYEHFDSKPDESLTGLYDRFVKLLNDLSLVDKEYDLEDTNLKFLLALPESWDLKATTIRDNYALDETTLDEIYGMLKTHELEMDQRSKRHGRKSRTIALKAEEESPKVAVSKKGKGKALITKSNTESSSSDNDEDSETESLSEMDVDEEMMKLCALMVKGITKIAYRKFGRGKKFSRKSGSSDKKGFRKSEGKARKYDRGDYSNVKYYNCGEKDHISPDCKKGKGDKGKALVTKKKSWTDTSDSEDEVNYALMANADSSSEAAELKTNKPKVNPVKFVDKIVKSDSEKMKDAETEVKAESTSDKLKQDKPIEVNIGLMTKKQLKYKLKEIKNVNKVKPPRKNRNGKEGEIRISTPYLLNQELRVSLLGNGKNILVLDSGCSGHMTGNKALLSDFVDKAGPGVSYGHGNMGKTLGYGNINLRNVITSKFKGGWSNLIESVFGKAPGKHDLDGGRLRLNWLTKLLPALSDDANEDELIQYTQSYTLQQIGGILFTDHQGSQVHCMFLPLIQNLDRSKTLSWGAGVLAFLYRELCKACKKDTEEIAGCVLLLQLWAWTRLPTIAPIPRGPNVDNREIWGDTPRPFGLRWCAPKSYVDSSSHVVYIDRLSLDVLLPDYFVWMPYADVLDKLSNICQEGSEIWCYKGPIICFHIVEPHEPDRCLRQFNMVQDIPVPPTIYSCDMHNMNLKGKTKIDWRDKHKDHILLWNNRLQSVILIGNRGLGITDGYADWYANITRPYHTRVTAAQSHVFNILNRISSIATGAVSGDYNTIDVLAKHGRRVLESQYSRGLRHDFPTDDSFVSIGPVEVKMKKKGHKGGHGGVNAPKRRQFTTDKEANREEQISLHPTFSLLCPEDFQPLVHKKQASDNEHNHILIELQVPSVEEQQPSTVEKQQPPIVKKHLPPPVEQPFVVEEQQHSLVEEQQPLPIEEQQSLPVKEPQHLSEEHQPLPVQQENFMVNHQPQEEEGECPLIPEEQQHLEHEHAMQLRPLKKKGPKCGTDDYK
ncbi:hypothetical protein AgCh_028756 [Apium graveolens]